MDMFEKDFFEQAQYPLHGVQPYKIGEPKPETDLPFTLGVSVKTIPDFQMPSSPEWEFIDQGKRYRTHFAVDKVNGQWKLYVDCQGKGTFTYFDDQIHIEWVRGTGPDHYFQSLGLAIWLEMKGVICLHGNVVKKGQFGVAFLGKSGAGKTTLSLSVAGCEGNILTDDMFCLYECVDGFEIYSSWPVIRSWNSQIKRLGWKKEKVHKDFKKFKYTYERIKPEKIKITKLFFLNRLSYGDEILIRKLVGIDYFLKIIEQSIVGVIKSINNDEKNRLIKLGMLINKINGYSLTYKESDDMTLLLKRGMDG